MCLDGYFNDNPQGVSFRPFLFDPVHFRLFDKPALAQLPLPIQDLYNGIYGAVNSFLEDVAAGTLPSVAFVDSASGSVFDPTAENDEHPGPAPGSNIRAG
jgi:hypothetical protein